MLAFFVVIALGLLATVLGVNKQPQRWELNIIAGCLVVIAVVVIILAMGGCTPY
jgi:hypothetical protein